jgi:cyanophycin synthetase
VVNGDDPRTFAMRLGSPAKPFVFSRDPGSPALRAALNEGGRAATVLDGDLVVLDTGGDPTHLLPVADIPMTLAGLSHFNVENALAAAAAGLSVGLPQAAVVDGLRDFQPDPTDNPGRMNIYSVRDVTVVIDLAHNEAGLAALLEVMGGLRVPGGRLLLALGTAGDRTDEIITLLGEIGARGADRTVIVHKDAYLRGRDTEDMDALYRAGAAAVGVHDVPSYGSELEGLRELLKAADAGDVVAIMCHQERPAVDAWLREQGGTVDDAETIRAKVLAARGPTVD